MGPLFTSADRPEYHDNMLLVRLQPIGSAAVTASRDAAFGFTRGSQGMSALSFYERAGLIRRVTPIESNRPGLQGHVVSGGTLGEKIASDVLGTSGLRAATILTAAGMNIPELPSRDTTSLIELERGEDVRDLQRALANDPNVASVSRVPVRYLADRRASRRGSSNPSSAAVPPQPGSMWNLRAIHWAQARQTKGYQEPMAVKVAVLDTGIDKDHQELAPQVARYVYNHPDTPAASSAKDYIGHGTHVAGTIAAGINNKLGVNGICHCEIHAWKIFDDRPDLVVKHDGTAEYVYYVDTLMYLRALMDCVELEMDVVNLSIGGPGKPSSSEAGNFEKMLKAGTTVVAAMGNERMYGSPTSFPAAIPGVIAVGATNINDRVTSFSNRGNHITISAPGDAIWSTLPTYSGQAGWEAVRAPDGKWREGAPHRRETEYDSWAGTSMATPHVAGAVAVYLANGGTRRPEAVKQALIETAEKVPDMGGAKFHADYGYGRLDLAALVAHAAASKAAEAANAPPLPAQVPA